MRIVRLTIVTAVFAIVATSSVFAQGAYWQHRVSLFRALPNPTGEICFLGDSITDYGLWQELTGIESVTNRGISGDTSRGIMARIEEVYEGKPAKIFLMIGTNDLAHGRQPSEVLDEIAAVLDTLKFRTPETAIYLQSVFPVRDDMRTDNYKNAGVNLLNPMLETLAREKGVTWIDVRPVLMDEDGQLKRELTSDGLHLNGQAYYLWYSVIRRYLAE